MEYNEFSKQHPKVHDLTGQRFGRLTVVEPVGINAYGVATWRCVCDCGNERILSAQVLTGNRTQSCGCLQKERHRKAMTTHGKSYSPLYRTWSSIKSRCYNPKASGWDMYGARGITVCPQWKDNFEQFYKDMHEGYDEKKVLGRIDTSGPYSKENCLWTSIAAQANRRRNTIRVTMPDGSNVSLAEAARASGLSRETLRRRLQLDWPTERLFDPVEPRTKRNRKPHK